MANPEGLSEKAKKALMRGYRDLLTINKLIERYQGKEGANQEVFKNKILDEVHAENRDEMIFNRTLVKFENVLDKTLEKNSINPAEIADVIKRIEDFRKYLIQSLSKGGTLEKLAEKGDYAALRAEIEKDIRIDQELYKQIDALWKEMDEELENKKKEDAGDVKTTAKGTHVDISDADPTLLRGVFEFIGKEMGRPLKEDEMNSIKNKGLDFIIKNYGGPITCKELNYVTAIRSMKISLPVQMEFECRFATNGHKDIMRKCRGNIVNAGTIVQDGDSMRFSSFSSTWTTKFASNGTPLYYFGELVNKEMIKAQGLK